MKKKIVSLLLALALLGSLPVYADTEFTDVQESDWFYMSVSFAYSKGIINGVGNGEFKPYDTLTVAEAIKLSACIHANYHSVEITPDADSTHWADVYYDYAVENGIIKESDFAKADFDIPIIRDRVFYLFANALPESEYPEINDVEVAPEKLSTDYLTKLFCAGIVIGNEQGFESEKNITRAECAEMILRLTAHTRRRLVLEPMAPAVENEINQDVIANEMLTLVNEKRINAGKNVLTIHPELMEAAEILATEYSQGSDPHYRLDGRFQDTVIDDLGMSVYFQTNYGITAWGQSDRFHTNVMNSEGHARQVVASDYSYYGVACVRGSNGSYYWVECFATNR